MFPLMDAIYPHCFGEEVFAHKDTSVYLVGIVRCLVWSSTSCKTGIITPVLSLQPITWSFALVTRKNTQQSKKHMVSFLSVLVPKLRAGLHVGGPWAWDLSRNRKLRRKVKDESKWGKACLFPAS